MKLALKLSVATGPEWLTAVLSDFKSFLQDHADCERKASAMAMSFVAKYPDRVEIIPELIETGVEELLHFQEVYRIMAKRGIELAKEIPKDDYVNTLIGLCHSDQIRRFLDRLLLASIIECRGAERFRLLSEAMDSDPELRAFYHRLWVSEAKHGHIFVHMALRYFPQEQVYERLTRLNESEGEVIRGLRPRAALH